MLSSISTPISWSTHNFTLLLPASGPPGLACPLTNGPDLFALNSGFDCRNGRLPSSSYLRDPHLNPAFRVGAEKNKQGLGNSMSNTTKRSSRADCATIFSHNAESYICVPSYLLRPLSPVLIEERLKSPPHLHPTSEGTGSISRRIVIDT